MTLSPSAAPSRAGWASVADLDPELWDALQRERERLEQVTGSAA